MTLCIAATCEDQDRKETCIVVSSDWKAEVGDVAAAEIQNKLYWMFDESWPTLIAGTALKVRFSYQLMTFPVERICFIFSPRRWRCELTSPPFC
jgi:hypothetical protein